MSTQISGTSPRLSFKGFQIASISRPALVSPPTCFEVNLPCKTQSPPSPVSKRIRTPSSVTSPRCPILSSPPTLTKPRAVLSTSPVATSPLPLRFETPPPPPPTPSPKKPYFSTLPPPPPGFSLEEEQEVNFSVFGAHSVPEMVGKGPFRGLFNNLDADLLVFDVDDDILKDCVKSFARGPMRGKYLAEFFGVQRLHDSDNGKVYRIYGFETSKKSLTALDTISNSFGVIQDFIHQCLKSVEYVHNKGHFANFLSSEDSFCFDQVDDTVTVKLYPYKCVSSCSVPDSRKKESDIQDFSQLVTKLFFGSSASLVDVLSYNPKVNVPAIKFVPEIEGNRRCYTMEVVHFVRVAAAGCLTGRLLNEPLQWTSSKRLDLFRDGSETMGSWSSTNGFFAKLNNLPCFIEKCRSDWGNFPSSVRVDLRAPNQSPNATISNLKFCKGSVSDFLRSVRNFLAHRIGKPNGKKYYLEFDPEYSKGFDLYMSAEVPGLLIGVYDLLWKERESGFVWPALERYLKPSYTEYLSN